MERWGNGKAEVTWDDAGLGGEGHCQLVAQAFEERGPAWQVSPWQGCSNLAFFVVVDF